LKLSPWDAETMALAEMDTKTLKELVRMLRSSLKEERLYSESLENKLDELSERFEDTLNES
jgi:uncharacterized membrane protein